MNRKFLNGELTGICGWMAALTVAINVFVDSASASKARLTALGQSSNGSLYVEDSRNIFLNPAVLNKNQNSVNFEWGNRAVGSSPKAEGGIIYTLENMSLSAQLGRVDNATQSMIDHGNYGSGGNFLIPQNSFDLIFAGSRGRNWGAGLHYASSDKETGANGGDYDDGKARFLSLTGGYYAESYSIYGLLDLTHDSETTDSALVKDKYSGKLSLEAGGTLQLGNESKVGLQFLRRSFDFDNGSGAKGSAETTAVEIRYHRNLLNRDRVLLFASSGLGYGKFVADYDPVGLANDEVGSVYLPVTIGLEAGLRDWLVLRGSVEQHVIIDKETSKSNTTDVETNGTDDTKVSAGMSLVFDDLSLDATFAGSGTNGTGNLDANELMTNVGMNYHF